MELNSNEQRTFLENVDFIDIYKALAFMKRKSPAAFSATTAVSSFSATILGTSASSVYGGVQLGEIGRVVVRSEGEAKLRVEHALETVLLGQHLLLPLIDDSPSLLPVHPLVVLN